MTITDRNQRASTSLPVSINLASVNWKGAQKNVRHIQKRIAKAEQQNNRRKAKSLRRLLAFSFSTKALAAKQATQHFGKKDVRDLNLRMVMPVPR